MSYTIKISDDFCEWEYELTGDDSYSIHDLVTVLVENTNLIVNEGKLIDDSHLAEGLIRELQKACERMAEERKNG